MKTVWVVITNASHCRIYSYDKSANQLDLLKEFDHYESKLKDVDLIADQHGSYKSKNLGAGVYAEAKDHRDVEKQQFAKQVTSELECGRAANCYNGLFIVAPPEFHGLLRKDFNKNLERMVLKGFQNDYDGKNDDQVLAFVREHRSVIGLD